MLRTFLQTRDTRSSALSALGNVQVKKKTEQTKSRHPDMTALHSAL